MASRHNVRTDIADKMFILTDLIQLYSMRVNNDFYSEIAVCLEWIQIMS